MEKKKTLQFVVAIVLVIALVIYTLFQVRGIYHSKTEKYSTVTVTFLGANSEVLKTEEIEKNSFVEQWDPENTEGFVGWFTEEDEVFDFHSKIDSDITLSAKWIAVEDIETYLVTFLVDGEFYESLDVPVNDVLIEPEDPTKEGYTFVGWYENDTLFDFDMPITSEHTVEARFA